MAKLDLTIGAPVHCTDKHCGTLNKVVVDPTTQRVTDLILEQGLLFKSARVVSVAAVERTTLDEIHLSLHSGELDDFAEYRATEIHEPAGRERHAPPTVDLMPGGLVSTPTAPMYHRRVHMGIAAGHVLLDHYTSIENISEDLGRVDHVIVDKETGRLLELVMRRGFFPDYYIVPIESVEEITGELILVSLFRDDVEDLPRYGVRSDAELVADLQESLNRAVPPVFRGVEVTAHAGVIRLSGYVSSNELKLHAEELAYLVPNIADVQNELVVTGVKEKQSMGIQSRENLVVLIDAALKADPRTKHAVIEVIDDRGLVTLQGEVESIHVRNAAESIATQLGAVTTVINELVIAGN